MFVEIGAQTVAIDVERCFLRKHVVDEGLLVNIFPVAILRVSELVAQQGILHFAEPTLNIFQLPVGDFVVFRIFQLHIHGIFRAVLVHPHIVRSEILAFFVAVHLQQVAAREFQPLVACFLQIEPVLSFSWTFRHDVDALIDAVDHELAVAGTRHILHPRPSQLKHQHVADLAAVLIRSDKHPVVVGRHTHHWGFQSPAFRIAGHDGLHAVRLFR